MLESDRLLFCSVLISLEFQGEKHRHPAPQSNKSEFKVFRAPAAGYT